MCTREVCHMLVWSLKKKKIMKKKITDTSATQHSAKFFVSQYTHTHTQHRLVRMTSHLTRRWGIYLTTFWLHILRRKIRKTHNFLEDINRFILKRRDQWWSLCRSTAICQWHNAHSKFVDIFFNFSFFLLLFYLIFFWVRSHRVASPSLFLFIVRRSSNSRRRSYDDDDETLGKYWKY